MSDISELTRTAPERIYLQIADGGEADTQFPHGEEITWCEDSIMHDEVEYVRADLAAERQESQGVTERYGALKQDHAYLLQSYRYVVAQHTQMVEKLREFSLQWRELSEAAHKDGELDRRDIWEDASRRLAKLISAEPASPVNR